MSRKISPVGDPLQLKTREKIQKIANLEDDDDEKISFRQTSSSSSSSNKRNPYEFFWLFFFCDSPNEYSY
jgi:hypothetical protein